ncbi:hypothetical protein HDV00_010650 [Rhizophlyctis rosea]|nr:hypothetical protein HDV00_010650 [Rhizophlyctis rosea]
MSIYVETSGGELILPTGTHARSLITKYNCRCIRSKSHQKLKDYYIDSVLPPGHYHLIGENLGYIDPKTSSDSTSSQPQPPPDRNQDIKLALRSLEQLQEHQHQRIQNLNWDYDCMLRSRRKFLADVRKTVERVVREAELRKGVGMGGGGVVGGGDGWTMGKGVFMHPFGSSLGLFSNGHTISNGVRCDAGAAPAADGSMLGGWGQIMPPWEGGGGGGLMNGPMPHGGPSCAVPGDGSSAFFHLGPNTVSGHMHPPLIRSGV